MSNSTGPATCCLKSSQLLAPRRLSEKILDELGKMKPGKAAGPSGITAEMLKATGPDCVKMLRQLGEHTHKGDPIPRDWEESIILNLYKGKGDARAIEEI